ncbi:MAG: hypothetical protein RSB38_07380, partial [Oscillospiraceae bacterium]
MIKKAVSLILFITFMLNLLPIAINAAEEPLDKTIIPLLTKLEIIDKNEFEEEYLNEAIDGFMLNNIITNLKGLENNKMLKQEPTVQEFCEQLVDVLGYSIYANEKGYNNLSIYKDILKEADIEEGMTKRNAIKMIFKALSSDVMELTGVGKYVSYKIMKGKTFLYQRYNISEEYGRVTGIYGINISNGGDVGEGQIKIGDRVLKGVTREDEKLIGYNVHYYWKETNSGDASLFMMLEDKNSILKINAEDINDFSQGELSYTDGKNIRKIKILPSFDLIFNGCKDVPSTLTMLPKTGNITLIKNNKTGEYDVVIVKSYEHMIVQSVDLEKQIIYPDAGELEASNTNVREFSIKDTAKKDVEIKSLLKFDALLVAQSRNDEVCEILFSDKIVNGTIQEINSYGKKKKVKINGKEY